MPSQPPVGELLASSGDDQVDRSIRQLIDALQPLLADADAGFYLHGSWAAGAAHPTSDVDVLALTRTAVDPSLRGRIRAVSAQVAESTGVPLDVHLHDVATLISDPYVDLRRVGVLLSGVDYRPTMPEATLDARAREAVLVSCDYVTTIRGIQHVRLPFDHPNADDEFWGRLPSGDPTRLAKVLTWLSSALMSSAYGVAPTSASDGLAELGAHSSFGTWVARAVDDCRSGAPPTDPDRRAHLAEICEQMLLFEAATIDSVCAAVASGRLGPKCAALVDKYIDRAAPTA